MSNISHEVIASFVAPEEPKDSFFIMKRLNLDKKVPDEKLTPIINDILSENRTYVRYRGIRGFHPTERDILRLYLGLTEDGKPLKFEEIADFLKIEDPEKQKRLKNMLRSSRERLARELQEKLV